MWGSLMAAVQTDLLQPIPGDPLFKLQMGRHAPAQLKPVNCAWYCNDNDLVVETEALQ